MKLLGNYCLSIWSIHSIFWLYSLPHDTRIFVDCNELFYFASVYSCTITDIKNKSLNVKSHISSVCYHCNTPPYPLQCKCLVLSRIFFSSCAVVWYFLIISFIVPVIKKEWRLRLQVLMLWRRAHVVVEVWWSGLGTLRLLLGWLNCFPS